MSRTGVDAGGLAVLSPTDVWVGGETVEGEFGPVLLHYNGVAWSSDLSLAAEGWIKDMWGSSGSDVYALGETRVLHFNGTRWSPLFDGRADHVWGSSAANVFILRNNEILYRLPA